MKRRIKFWLKDCPNCGHQMDAVGFNRKVSLKDASVACRGCGSKLKSVFKPTATTKFLYRILLPVSLVTLGASVYTKMPYSGILFYVWGLYLVFMFVSIFNSFELETIENKNNK